MKTPHLVPDRRALAEPKGTSGLAGVLIELFRSLHLHRNVRSCERQMRLLETLPLGGKRQLMLVSCGPERFLIGSGPESVQTIVQLGREATETSLQSPVHGRVQSIGEQT